MDMKANGQQAKRDMLWAGGRGGIQKRVGAAMQGPVTRSKGPCSHAEGGSGHPHAHPD